MIGNLFKAAVATVLLPVGVVIDVCTLPSHALGERRSATATLAKAVKKNVEEAIKP